MRETMMEAAETAVAETALTPNADGKNPRRPG